MKLSEMKGMVSVKSVSKHACFFFLRVVAVCVGLFRRWVSVVSQFCLRGEDGACLVCG